VFNAFFIVLAGAGALLKANEKATKHIYA
jgi:hypothetical protein